MTSSLATEVMDVVSSSDLKYMFRELLVSYKKGIVEPTHYIRRTGCDASGPFFEFWENSFATLDLRLVVADKCPENVVNDDDWGYERDYRGPYVVWNGAAKDGWYVAVLDHLDPTRAFVGQILGGGVTSVLAGGVRYFDSQGNMEGPKEAIDAALFTFDLRNGCPSWDNLFLCGNTLSYVWSHRSSPAIQVDGYCFRRGFSRISSWFEATSYNDVEGLKKQVLLGRWLCCFSERINAYCCIDLKSCRVGTDANTAAYDSVTIPTCLLVPDASMPFNATCQPAVAILESLKDVPTYEPTERDGYPVSCIKCGQDTATGSLSVGSGRFGLGCAICTHCMIRYSETNKCWMCCEVRQDAKQDCDCKVSPPEYQCAQTHADESVATIRVKVKKRKRYEEQDTVSMYASLNKKPAPS